VPIWQVVDDQGTDRTPKPLLSVKPTALRQATQAADTSMQGSSMAFERLSFAGFAAAGGSGRQLSAARFSSNASFTPDTMSEEGSRTVSPRGPDASLLKVRMHHCLQ
jgi:hypothetical protein